MAYFQNTDELNELFDHDKTNIFVCGSFVYNISAEQLADCYFSALDNQP